MHSLWTGACLMLEMYWIELLVSFASSVSVLQSTKYSTSNISNKDLNYGNYWGLKATTSHKKESIKSGSLGSSAQGSLATATTLWTKWITLGMFSSSTLAGIVCVFRDLFDVFKTWCYYFWDIFISISRIIYSIIETYIMLDTYLYIIETCLYIIETYLYQLRDLFISLSKHIYINFETYLCHYRDLFKSYLRLIYISFET